MNPDKKKIAELEARLSAMEQAFELSEGKYKEIFNNANDAMILWASNEHGKPLKVLEVNDVALRLTGYTRKEFLALNSAQLRDPDEAYDSKAASVVLKEKNSHTFEVTIYAKDKKKIPTEINAHLFKFQGEYVVLAVHRDITERKEFERKLIEAKELAEESDRLKSTFLANMSHEIRTPMNAIMGFTDLLQAGGITEKDQATYTKIIQYKGEQLMTLINDILYLSKVEADQVDLSIVPCDMSEYFNMVSLNWQKMIERSDNSEIDLKIDYAQVKDLVIELDDMRLSQILNNLVSNSIKFTPKGSITVACIRQKNALYFSVEDTGIGIPEDKYAIIFDRFRQVDDGRTRQYGGTGLGLAICKKLVSVMGGEIGVQSKEGKGSRFWFTIPCELSHAQINSNN